MTSEEMIFFAFFFFSENLVFRLPWQPIKFSGLDKIHMLGRGLLKDCGKGTVSRQQLLAHLAEGLNWLHKGIKLNILKSAVCFTPMIS